MLRPSPLLRKRLWNLIIIQLFNMERELTPKRYNLSSFAAKASRRTRARDEGNNIFDGLTKTVKQTSSYRSRQHMTSMMIKERSLDASTKQVPAFPKLDSKTSSERKLKIRLSSTNSETRQRPSSILNRDL